MSNVFGSKRQETERIMRNKLDNIHFGRFQRLDYAHVE
jgi:hypothetical protein